MMDKNSNAINKNGQQQQNSNDIGRGDGYFAPHSFKNNYESVNSDAANGYDYGFISSNSNE